MSGEGITDSVESGRVAHPNVSQPVLDRSDYENYARGSSGAGLMEPVPSLLGRDSSDLQIHGVQTAQSRETAQPAERNAAVPSDDLPPRQREKLGQDISKFVTDRASEAFMNPHALQGIADVVGGMSELMLNTTARYMERQGWRINRDQNGDITAMEHSIYGTKIQLLSDKVRVEMQNPMFGGTISREAPRRVVPLECENGVCQT